MPTMLSQALRDEAAAIGDELVRGLQGPQTPHYRGTGEDLLRRRCQRLVEAFLESCDGEPAAFSAHVRGVTRERILEGYYLAEMQSALSILEAAAWCVVVDRSNVAILVHHLSVVTSVIGHAKDELATAYLDDAIRSRTELRRLSEGTDAYIGAEEEGEPALARARS